MVPCQINHFHSFNLKDKLELLTSYFFPFAHWLAFSNSSVNPIIYGYYNENFKRGFQAICRTYSCCCPFWRGGLKLRDSRDHRAPACGGGDNNNRPCAPTGPNPTNTINFGSRNRVHSGCKEMQAPVHLELESRKRLWSYAEGAESQTAQGDSSMGSESNNRKGTRTENVEMMSPAGPRVSQAWDQ